MSEHDQECEVYRRLDGSCRCEHRINQSRYIVAEEIRAAELAVISEAAVYAFNKHSTTCECRLCVALDRLQKARV